MSKGKKNRFQPDFAERLAQAREAREGKTPKPITPRKGVRGFTITNDTEPLEVFDGTDKFIQDSEQFKFKEGFFFSPGVIKSGEGTDPNPIIIDELVPDEPEDPVDDWAEKWAKDNA